MLNGSLSQKKKNLHLHKWCTESHFSKGTETSNAASMSGRPSTSWMRKNFAFPKERLATVSLFLMSICQKCEWYTLWFFCYRSLLTQILSNTSIYTQIEIPKDLLRCNPRNCFLNILAYLLQRKVRCFYSTHLSGSKREKRIWQR